MTASIILAKLIGPYCLIVATGVLLNLKTYQKMIEDLIQNSALVYLSGIFALIVGLLMVQFHNIWVLDWPVAITIVGWLGVIKGVRLIVFPNSLPKAIEFYRNNTLYLVIRLILIILLGLALTLWGYFEIPVTFEYEK
ncbi:MAG: hypothetical protein NUV91_09620 [Candidatus Omnitrophica bacterium]|nr:hypothetical protein [Candidatus Omnitrophota bacterium]